MKQRVLTGAGILAVLILIFFSRYLTIYIADVVFIALATVAGFEMSKLISRKGNYNHLYFVISYPVVSYGLFILSVVNTQLLKNMLLIQLSLLLVYFGVATLVSMFAKRRSENEIKTRKLKMKVEKFAFIKGINTLFCVLYPCLPIMLLVFLNHVDNLSYIYTPQYGLAFVLLLYAFFIPMITDTFAMFTGMIFGGKKLAPKISPKKTISGAVGGIVWAMLLSTVLFFILNSFDNLIYAFNWFKIEFWHFIILSFIGSVVCQFGDLFESYLKRKANVKDVGDFLPGHGGFLDRFDSLIFNVVVIFVYCLIIII